MYRVAQTLTGDLPFVCAGKTKSFQGKHPKSGIGMAWETYCFENAYYFRFPFWAIRKWTDIPKNARSQIQHLFSFRLCSVTVRFEQNVGSGLWMRPNQATFIGIGGQKCATTWLHSTLAQCPGVALGREKEVDFFSYYFDRGSEWYERQFDIDGEAVHRGDISPSYLIHPSAPARAVHYNPDLHILVTLRDPVKRAYSNHLHEARKGHISGDNLRFENALENNPLYIDQGRYAAHLAGWFAEFPKEQILVLFQEEINRDRVAMARRVTDHMNLPPLVDFLDLRENESVRYRNPLVGETLWKIGGFARRVGFGSAVEKSKSLPGIRHLRNANREAMTDVIAPMAQGTETALTELFADDVAALEMLLDRPVPWPRYRPAEDARPV